MKNKNSWGKGEKGREGEEGFFFIFLLSNFWVLFQFVWILSHANIMWKTGA